jgi:protein-S-isoprenylcysteine O-methyltransferase Ste14
MITAFLMWLLSVLLPQFQMVLLGANGLAVLVFCAGMVVAVAGVLSFRKAQTTVNPVSPHKASSLVISGIYRYTRNPMYLGFALWQLGWALFLSNVLALVMVPVFMLYMNRFQIRPEEAALEKLFGAEFTAYKQAVRRWL